MQSIWIRKLPAGQRPAGDKTATSDPAYKKLYNVQIAMGKTTPFGGTGAAGNVLEVVRPGMNGSSLDDFMIVLMIRH